MGIHLLMNNLHIGALHLFCSISMFLLKAQTGVLATGLQVLTKAHRSLKSFLRGARGSFTQTGREENKNNNNRRPQLFQYCSVLYCILWKTVHSGPDHRLFFGKRPIAGPITGYSLENGPQRARSQAILWKTARSGCFSF